MSIGGTSRTPWRITGWLLVLGILGLLILPWVGLLSSSSPQSILAGLSHPLFLPALWLSFYTTCWSLLFVVLTGTPLAWWLAHSSSRYTRVVQIFVDLPLVIPPAVVGIALLYTFGRQGWLGSILAQLGLQLPFTTTAVVMAQVMMAAPFYIQSATASFRAVDHDLLLVSRTLGQSAVGTMFRVVIPLALPGLINGMALAWGRALGEFGATLLFAGNLPHRTQTMPLAIYSALESDVHAALALSLCLAGFGVCLLFAVRMLPNLFRHSSPTRLSSQPERQRSR